jgi:drug/metabolite transporter (DMT)-like permease
MSAAARQARSGPLAGIAMTLLGTFVFAFSNALAKKLMATYPFGETLFVRSAVALMLLAPFVHKRDFVRMRQGGQAWLHALRCGCSAIEVCCYYWAVTGMKLADTSTIYLAGPIYTTALAAIFLREQVGWRRWSAVFVGFLGVIIALRPGTSALGLHAIVAVIGSLLYSISLVAVRRLRETPNTLLVGTQVASLNVVALATIPFGWVMPTPLEGFGLILVGIISTGGYLFVNRGLQLAPASITAPFQYVSIVFAMTLGFLLFGEVPLATTFIGAAVIVGAGLFIVMRERYAAR